MKDLSQFIVYQPNAKEFHICLEAGKTYYCWWSYYPPTQDNRFARRINRLRDIAPKEIPKKQIYDKGTYTVNKGDDKVTTEAKLKNGIKKKSFSFILNGKKLKGRFIIKKTSGGTLIQKFKDRFAAEEDVLGGDLSRTISLMVPGYDPKKVKLNKLSERKTEQPTPKATPLPINEPAPEEISADTTIGNTSYHFDFYRCDDAPDLCLITNAKQEILVLKKIAGKWQLLKGAGAAALKKEKEMIQHARALEQQLQDA